MKRKRKQSRYQVGTIAVFLLSCVLLHGSGSGADDSEVQSGEVEYIEYNADGRDGVVLFLDEDLVFSVSAEALANGCQDLQIGQCVELSGIDPQMVAMSCARVNCE